MESDQPITPELTEWAILAFDHVRIGDFEGAIALIQEQGSRKALEILARRVKGDVRTAQMDTTPVLSEIERRSSLLGLN